MTFPTPAPETGLVMSDGMYKKLKWLATLVLPALITLVATLGPVWEFENVGKVVATLGALNTFLGVIIGVSTRSYNNSDAKYSGTLNVEPNDMGGKTVTLDVGENYGQLDMMPEVLFKVITPPTDPPVVPTVAD